MLAEDEISIRVGKDVVYLRPTLRAAMRLERTFGGFDKLIEAIQGGNVTAMASIIRECQEHRSDLPRLIEGLADAPLCQNIEEYKRKCIAVVLQLAGLDADEKQDDAEGEKITFAEHFARLYRNATGWLGWTPEVTLTATPSEIAEALKGRVELLKSIFGSADAEPQAEQTPEVFNATLSAVLAMASARFAEAA